MKRKTGIAVKMAVLCTVFLTACAGVGTGAESTSAVRPDSGASAEPDRVASDRETAALKTAEPESAETVETEAGGNTAETGKTLVVYYSATGNTEEAANYIAEAANADVFVLEPAEAYSSEDLNWTDDNSRVVYEHDNPDGRAVELVAETVPDWEAYDTVFIGYPIWWGIAAWPVDGFIEANDFTGKTVIPFCTSSSSGLGESGELLAGLAGTGNWLEGRRFTSGASKEAVLEWVESLGL